MKKLMLAAFAALMMATVPALALVSLGYQRITSLSSATGLTVPSGAYEALIVCETQDVRWRDDGTAPTASTGMLLPARTALPYTANLAAIKIIETTASAQCNIMYFQ